MKQTKSFPTLQDLKSYFAENKEEILKRYFEFLRFKSVSTESTYTSELLACADWVMQYLKEIGFHVEKWSTTGHPTLFASYEKAGSNQPTLMIYHHYDVQPVDPLPEWKAPPFEPTIRDGEVYARGAQDNKGQCFYTLLALKAIIEKTGSLPINIKLCIEGEEEAGSIGLAQLLQEKKDKLKADYLAIVDAGIQESHSPSICLGIRGIITMDVEVQCSHIDMHSGCNGGLLYNPIHALLHMLNSLRDINGKITIPGFYDDVVPMKDEDRKLFSWKFDEDKYFKDFGAYAVGGERNLPPLERNWIRPTLEINGITGGYSGQGFKTVIPAKASAKISCRLVPNQEPQKIGKLVADYIKKQAPEGVNVSVHVHPGGGTAARANPNSTVVKAFAAAYSSVFQKPCEYVLEGASIPIVSKLSMVSDSELVLVGMGLPSDQIHAPNEHFGIDRLEKGFLIISKAIEELKND